MSQINWYMQMGDQLIYNWNIFLSAIYFNQYSIFFPFLLYSFFCGGGCFLNSTLTSLRLFKKHFFSPRSLWVHLEMTDTQHGLWKTVFFIEMRAAFSWLCSENCLHFDASLNMKSFYLHTFLMFHFHFAHLIYYLFVMMDLAWFTP